MEELGTAGLPTQPQTALCSLRQKTGTGGNLRPQKVLGVQQGDKSLPGVRGLGPHTVLPWYDRQGLALQARGAEAHCRRVVNRAGA